MGGGGNPNHDPSNGEFSSGSGGGSHTQSANAAHAHMKAAVAAAGSDRVHVPIGNLQPERGASMAGWRGEKVPEFTPGGRKEALAKRDSGIVNGLRQVLKSGKELDPIHVKQEGQNFRILDGHHRYIAYEMEGRSHIPAKLAK